MTSSTWTGSLARAAARGQSSACRNGLLHRHAALEAEGAGPLHFAGDVGARRPLDVDDVAAGHLVVLVQLALAHHVDDVDGFARGLAVARAHQADQVAAIGVDAAGHRQQVEHLAPPFDRVAPRAVDLAQHRHLLAGQGRDDHVDLGFFQVAALLQQLADLLLGGGHRQAADADLSQQRESDGAAFADARLDRQVGTAVDRQTHHVARSEQDFGGAGNPGAYRQHGRRHPVCKWFHRPFSCRHRW